MFRYERLDARRSLVGCRLHLARAAATPRQLCALLSLQKRVTQRGRPFGATTFEPAPALAFGAVVRALRTTDGLAQEALAYRAGIERSHMGKIERGEHMPTLALILRIANALERSAGKLLLETEAALSRPHEAPSTDS